MFWTKVKRVLQSRKFWALLAGLITIAATYYGGRIDAFQAASLTVGALAVYSTGVAIEDNGFNRKVE